MSSKQEDKRLGMSAPISRRDVVNGILAGSGALLMGGCATGADAAEAAGPLVDAFTGRGGVGDYALSNGNTQAVINAAHRVRDMTFDELPTAEDSEQVDLVIVGGGPAGLLTAFDYANLTGGKKTSLILENHPIFGGASKQNDFLVSGVRLTGPQAANDFGVPAKGSGGIMDRVFDDLDLPREYGFASFDPKFKPLRFAWDNYTNMDGFGERLVDIGYHFNATDGATSPRLARNIWDDDLARTPFSPELRRQLLAWRANAGGTSDLTPEQLDGMSYAHYLEVVKGYDPAVTRVARPPIALLSGLGMGAVSALAASRYVTNNARQTMSFPGGNSGMVRPLIKKMFPGAIGGENTFADILSKPINFAAFDRPGQPTRLRLGATAVRVGHTGKAGSEDGVLVVYEKGGRLHQVRAKAVVMASGGWVNRRVLADMPTDIASAYGEFVHGPALVINVALTNWRAMYDLGVTALRWFDDANMLGFSGNIRAPMLVDGMTPPLDPDKPALFTMYMGVYSIDGTDARAQTVANRIRLLGTPYAEYERIVRQQLATILAGTRFDPAKDIAGIVINRWGHARVVQPPGFFLGRDGKPSPLKVVAKGYGRVIIAHSELNGAQNARGAFEHGARAAREAAALT
ncbi:NAD(P)-binding protein [Caulobacter sp. UC70_42]|uniref:NAD(P)-binding protein n=1 Tax=Caulobacter sp. UC70_42 TaxID=3374551 RepID=UPI0037572E2C